MGGFPALMIKQPESPVQQLAGVQQLQAGQQEHQMRQLELQNARQAQQEQQTLMAAYARNNGDLGAVLQDPQVLSGVRPQTALTLSNLLLDKQTKMAKLQTDQLTNQATQNDLIGGVYDSAKKIPDPAQRESVLKNGLGGLVTNGSISAQQAAQVLQGFGGNYSDESMSMHLASTLGHAKDLANELERRKTAATEQSAAGTLLRGQAAAALVPSEQAKNAALTAEAQKKTEQAGQVTPAIQYEQQQANYRALLGRQAESANATGRQGLENLQKQGDDYAKYSRQADAVKTAIAQGLAGNQVAASLAPLGAAVFEMKANGDIARVNPQVFADVKGAGSLVERINGAIGQLQGTGPLSPQLSKDLGELIDKYQDVKYDSYKKQAEYTIKLHKDPETNSLGRVNAHDVPILAKDGTTTTLGEASKPAQKSPTGPPPEATHKVPGKDGKMHYTNAQGTKDLGVVPDGQ